MFVKTGVGQMTRQEAAAVSLRQQIMNWSAVIVLLALGFV